MTADPAGTNRPTLAWIDTAAGIAGDMLLGALLDAGADPAVVNAAVAAADPRLSIGTERTDRHSIAATHAVVLVDGRPHPEAVAAGNHDHDHNEHGHGHGHGHGHEHGHEHGHDEHGPSRPYAAVRDLLDSAELDPVVRERAHGVFARLARAEATAHGVAVDDVVFHEVGALDAIADVVGCCAAFADLGITHVVAAPPALGGGAHVHGQHGGIPVPGPAVLSLLAEAVAPARGGAVERELTTPTGAALLTEFADAYGPMPAMRPGRVGCGAGTRDLAEIPNLVRVVLGAPVGEAAATSPDTDTGTDTGIDAVVERQLLLETNVDDLDPRVWPRALEAVFGAGAVDAWITPVQMKKGRPGAVLSVLCAAETLSAVQAAVFAETSTIGVRVSPVDRYALPRRFAAVEVDGQTIAVKVARSNGRVVSVQPEYDDVLAAATALRRPVPSVLAAAVAAGHHLWS